VPPTWTPPSRRAAASHRRALSIDPNSELAHSALASVYAHVGLFDRALEHFDAALRRGAGAAAVAMRVSRVHLYRQEYEAALNLLRANAEVARSWQTVSALDHLGRRQEAQVLVEELVSEAEKSGDAEALSDAASMRAILSARLGDRPRVEKDVVLAVRRGRGTSHFHHAAYNMASAYALLGRNGEALAWLRRTANEGMPCYPLFASDPNLDGLRSDPDFASFLAGIKAESERLAAAL
jgi:tetratricopeptide (TPR) repeat protein